MGSVSGAQVHHFLEALRGLGRDGETLCGTAGLDPSAVLAAGARVPWSTAVGLFSASAAAHNDPLIGLHAAEAAGARGVLAYLVRAQPTVEQAMHRLVRYAPVASDQLAVQLDRGASHAVLRIALGAGRLAGERHVREYTAALFVIELRESSRRRFRAGEVRLPDPAGGPGAEYERIFDCAVRFRQPALEIVVAAPMLAVDLPTRSPEIAEVLERTAREELALAETSAVAPRVERALRAAFADRRDPTPDEVATILALSRRTLQRRLGEEGTSFRAVRDKACLDHAVERLRDRATSVSTVADELGFADVAAFGKAFRRWTGATPRAWRRRLA
jgi:AraC-like DNA-binding protein